MTASAYSRLLAQAQTFCPSPRAAALIVSWVIVVTVLGIVLSSTGSVLLWAFGQAVLAVAMVQWFVLLHECGHGTLFGIRWVDRVVGHTASVFTVLPLHSWRPVHRLHHRWTGWLDLDPTGEAIVPRSLARYERVVLDVCWRFWLPLFSFLYRTNNYWNLPRLHRRLGRRSARAARRNVGALVAVYALFAVVVGLDVIARTFGVAFVLSLAMLDPILISQHTHVPWGVSRGRAVERFEYRQQDELSRALDVPRSVSRLILFNFNAHDLHHLVPAVPGYHLHRLSYDSAYAFPWRAWLHRAKAVPGHVLLFSDRRSSGIDI